MVRHGTLQASMDDHKPKTHRAINVLAKSPSGDGWLTTAMLIKEGPDDAREDAIAHINATDLLKKISEESKSALSRIKHTFEHARDHA